MDQWVKSGAGYKIEPFLFQYQYIFQFLDSTKSSDFQLYYGVSVIKNDKYFRYGTIIAVFRLHFVRKSLFIKIEE